MASEIKHDGYRLMVQREGKRVRLRSHMMKRQSRNTFSREIAADAEHMRRASEASYLRMLDADTKGADWREVARVVLHLDPEHESDRARTAFESHLSRADD
jgi:ATP-dependent DNA ligase